MSVALDKDAWWMEMLAWRSCLSLEYHSFWYARLIIHAVLFDVNTHCEFPAHQKIFLSRFVFISYTLLKQMVCVHKSDAIIPSPALQQMTVSVVVVLNAFSFRNISPPSMFFYIELPQNMILRTEGICQKTYTHILSVPPWLLTLSFHFNKSPKFTY